MWTTCFITPRLREWLQRRRRRRVSSSREEEQWPQISAARRAATGMKDMN
jgi:hypothetical protein